MPLFTEHLGLDTARLDGVAAMQLHRCIAQQNRHRYDMDDPD